MKTLILFRDEARSDDALEEGDVVRVVRGDGPREGDEIGWGEVHVEEDETVTFRLLLRTEE